jgi:hypothetical protein
MKGKIKALFLLILLPLFLPTLNLEAKNLTCWDIDGMSIFGYKSSEYIYIGSIANNFNINSIANEFGWGSKFKLNSIMNNFGSFGSKFSSYSAFNELASNPPIIINRNHEFVGYLTINNFKAPSVNTYVAIACAKNSFKSSIREHEYMVFKNIPGRDYEYPAVGEDWQSIMEKYLKTSCPANSQYVDGGCVCNEGYLWDGSRCVTYDQSCQSKYGPNSYGDKQYCYCSAGYEWNMFRTTCIKSITCPSDSILEGNNCWCIDGYKWDEKGINCIKEEEQKDRSQKKDNLVEQKERLKEMKSIINVLLDSIKDREDKRNIKVALEEMLEILKNFEVRINIELLK